MRKLTAHIFVCQNSRAPGHPRGCCQERGSEEILKRFKEEIARTGLQPTIRAQKAGCLDACEEGPTLVIYPEGIWYGHVQPQDVAEIVDSHLVRGIPVERLRIHPTGASQ